MCRACIRARARVRRIIRYSRTNASGARRHRQCERDILYDGIAEQLYEVDLRSAGMLLAISAICIRVIRRSAKVLDTRRVT